MSGESISIRGARQNNLAGIDVEIPRDHLVAITGVSGSGKSSLAFDTLFREGQRRFLETLSAYARQFLGRMEKPDVDHVEGLSPAIAVDQHTVQRGPRSTVGTLTEIHDYLRVLYARAGTAHCPEHGTPLERRTPESVVRALLEGFAGEPVHVLAPLIRDRKGEHRALLDDLKRRGFVRVRVDGTVARLEDVPALERYKRHTVEVVVDRLTVAESALGRLREAVDAALALGKGDLIAHGPRGEQAFSTQRGCSQCGAEAPPLEPRLFSFNSPHGACPRCQGLGTLHGPSEALVVRDPELSIRKGALAVTRSSGGALNFPRVEFKFLERIGKAHGFDLDTPWKDLSRAARKILLWGTGEERFRDTASWSGERYQGQVTWDRRFRGVLAAIQHAQELGRNQRHIARYLSESTCPDCNGTRLHPFASAVTVGHRRLPELLALPVGELGPVVSALGLSTREAAIARDLVVEIVRRAEFLRDVGLGYLSLERGADTLSGGEAQRIRLAAQLGSGLQGVLYVLDEPSIGLHAEDCGGLLRALEALRDAGNTVVVVEHDEGLLRASDWIVDIGPGAGRAGGRLAAEGTPAEVARADTPTGRLLRGEIRFATPPERRKGNGTELVLCGARGHNLRGVDLAIPLGTFTAVAGVSGSGKSTLIEGTLRRALLRHLERETPSPEPFERLEGADAVLDVVSIDAAPIGRTPRSNPATYSGAFDPIRDLFATLPESRMRGWKAGRFSFNVEGGRCEACQGAGAELVELQFLAPVTVACAECGGHRFQAETLGARFKEKSIADVLAMTVDEALAFFADHPKIARPLATLATVGLGYVSLGQPSTTLSGGEAQRVKLATHLQRSGRKHTLYLLDEPTTGLHQEDVAKLVAALQRLVESGHTVLVVEHNLDLLRAADRVVELGPGAGEAGGRIVAAGTPEDLEAADTPTGRALAAERARRKGGVGRSARRAKPLRAATRDTLSVRGARANNLASIDVDLPRDALTVVTGPSGSGKSSLALDTIHAAGKARFVESLSTYARQFLGSRDRPPVDRIDGLGPSIAVEAASSRGHPRSTVATTTEIHDHLRVLYARGGTPRCPAHGETLEPQDAGKVARELVKALDGRSGYVLAPIQGPSASGTAGPGKSAARMDRAALAKSVESWRAAGFARVLIDGAEHRLDAPLPRLGARATLDLVIDRVSFRADARTRLAEAVEQAAGLAGGRVSALVRAREGEAEPPPRLEFSTRGACPRCGFALAEPLEPRHFSFNTHVGACSTCDGLGQHWRADPELLVDSPESPLAPMEIASAEAALALGGQLGRYLLKGKGYYENLLRTVAEAHRIDLRRPFREQPAAAKRLLLFGEGAREQYQVESQKLGASFEMTERFRAEWPGLCGHVDRWHAKSEDPAWSAILEGVMRRQPCRECRGERLAPAPRAVALAEKRLPEVLALSVRDALVWLRALRLPADRKTALAPVLHELGSRLGLLERVGLGYVELDRPTSTLSGGEARRVRLASSLGSHLVGVCYVLDEPTVGLHPRDIDELCGALLELRDRGNTVIAVEHDDTLMRRADWLVELGPRAGRHGGKVVASGPPAELAKRGDTATARALRGELALLRERSPGAPGLREAQAGSTGSRVALAGATLHNLRSASIELAFGQITGVCGPSGSGKSTLILDTLVPALEGEESAGRWSSLATPPSGVPRVLVIDAAPLGRTPSSIPATAVGVMDPLRELYARSDEARARGFTAAYFSFNAPQGRCPACQGRGAELVEMQFLADLWLPCEECRGRRYRPEVLALAYRGLSIADVLERSVDEALEVFAHHPSIAAPLASLVSVGLGYLALGQSSTSLSVGEAQRVKLAAELLRARGGTPSVIVLDEPSTGLSSADLVPLLGVLSDLAARGDAIVLIEHHVGLLACCDRLVELGPGGGQSGGRVIATGTPEELAANARSVTGPWLAPALGRAHARTDEPARTRAAAGTEVAV